MLSSLRYCLNGLCTPFYLECTPLVNFNANLLQRKDIVVLYVHIKLMQKQIEAIFVLLHHKDGHHLGPTPERILHPCAH
jgi:hypothetical protein